jgi:hypothetical protein
VDAFARRPRDTQRAAPGPAARTGQEPADEPSGPASILRLQPAVGNRALAQLLQARPTGSSARSPVGAPTVQRRPSAADRRRRRRASALKAADARALLEASLPFAMGHLDGGELDRMQRVLDAAVVNPAVRKEADDLYRRSVIAQSGSVVNRDPGMVRRADEMMENAVPVSEADKRIRLDFASLLSPDALTPRTDNPDEVAYLARVRATLAARGVWLRFEPKLVRDPDDPSRWIVDPRSFTAWLSMGPDGGAIPTETGEITRESLVGTTAIGAGYYERVDQGPTQSALDHEVKRLLGDIESGVEQHNMLAQIRRDAFPGVTEAADLLGGADFPDRSMWDQPHQLVLRAMEMNVGGNVSGSQAFLVAAAIVTRNAARLLAAYIDDTSSGAERAVKVLKVAKAAGEVAQAGLAIAGGVGLVRGAAGMAGKAGAAAVAGDAEAAGAELARRYAARNGLHAGELAEVEWVPQPRGSIGGGVKPGGSSGAGTGWNKWP